MPSTADKKSQASKLNFSSMSHAPSRRWNSCLLCARQLSSVNQEEQYQFLNIGHHVVGGIHVAQKLGDGQDEASVTTGVRMRGNTPGLIL